jgi:hypothetical protein
LTPRNAKVFDAAVPDLHRVVDHFGLEEPLGPEIVHQVVGIRERVAFRWRRRKETLGQQFIAEKQK